MDSKFIAKIKAAFDNVIQRDDENQIEFWYARDLMPLLGYERWENFDKVIQRAVDSCYTAGIPIVNHFRGVTKMVRLGSGAQRNVKDYMLTRYACYLIAQNGDPQKNKLLLHKGILRYKQENRS